MPLLLPLLRCLWLRRRSSMLLLLVVVLAMRLRVGRQLLCFRLLLLWWLATLPCASLLPLYMLMHVCIQPSCILERVLRRLLWLLA